MAIPTDKQLVEAACHFGHRKNKWNPRMAKYIYGVRKGVHIFDVPTQRTMLQEMCEHLKKLHSEGKTILFASTKQQSTAFIEETGKALGQPTVTKKWIPGLLTNWKTIKQRIKFYLDLQKSFQSGEIEKYTKKEQLKLRKTLAKLDNALGGVSSMTGVPDAIFIIDGVLDHVGLLEARKLKIPVFGICDTNADPEEYTAFVPANDDAVKSISLILNTVVEELGGKVKKDANPEESEDSNDTDDSDEENSKE